MPDLSRYTKNLKDKLDEDVKSGKFSEWVKRLGQQHWSIPGTGETLCGRPMLGNNYANVIDDSRKSECEDCAKRRMEIVNDEVEATQG